MQIEFRTNYNNPSGGQEWREWKPLAAESNWLDALRTMLANVGPGATITVGIPRLSGEVDTFEYRERVRREYTVRGQQTIMTEVTVLAFDEAGAHEAAEEINWDEDEADRERTNEHIIAARIVDFGQTHGTNPTAELA